MALKDYKIVSTCPFGHECERVDAERKEIHRCRMYIALRGKHPQSEEEVDEYGCSLGDWLPILLVENAQANRGQTAALESFRNEVVDSQDRFTRMIATVQKTKLLEGS